MKNFYGKNSTDDIVTYLKKKKKIIYNHQNN